MFLSMVRPSAPTRIGRPKSEVVIRSNIRKFKPIENITRKVDEDVETDVLPDEGDILSDRMKKKRALKKEGIDLANITQTPRRSFRFA